MKKIIFALAAISVLAACSSGNKNKTLEKQKAELAKLQIKVDSLNSQIGVLQTSIRLAEGDSTNAKAKFVAVTTLQPSVFTHFVEVQASVDGKQDINVSSQTAGVVAKILVNNGDEVKTGQVLAQLDDAVIQQNIQELETAKDFANTMYQKQKNLWDQKIGTEVQYLSAKNNYESLVKKLNTLQQQEDMSQLKSPIDGTVDEIDIKLGQAVMPGIQTIRVVNLSELKVVGNVAESYISKVHKGDSVIVMFPDLKTQITSTVNYVSKVINPLNRSFDVEVKLPSNNVNYHPNMIAVLKIADYRSAAAITVPVNTIQSTEDGNYVYIATEKNGKLIAQKQAIVMGKNYNGTVEVLKGLSAGDKLISVGYEGLNQGDVVKY
ncbi:MAG TPA: efflux RND transporter periplasmic adaptor subunit [Bacteroidia bacterium]|nr:efflux RND transporter periplasmic adaptor subunit [Bacteroidia bacterium]